MSVTQAKRIMSKIKELMYLLELRFWAQRMSFSKDKNQYVILGVTGPNEYENNVNNNWYTNYAAKWCLDYAISRLAEIANRKSKKVFSNSTKT